MKYECWNPNCPNYAPGGVKLREREVVHARVTGQNDRVRCMTCMSVVRIAGHDSEGVARNVTGALMGGLIGFAFAGPAGLAVCAAVGLILALVTYRGPFGG